MCVCVCVCVCVSCEEDIKSEKTLIKLPDSDVTTGLYTVIMMTLQPPLYINVGLSSLVHCVRVCVCVLT